MVTRVTLCNRALSLIGQSPLQSETSTRSEKAFNLYQAVVEEVFAYPWRFAMRTVQLSRETATPDIHWDYKFKLPSGRLGPPRAVFKNSDTRIPFKVWDIIGDHLYADEDTLWCEYAKLPDPLDWPGDVRLIVVTLTASLLALAEREDAVLMDKLQRDVYQPKGQEPSLMQRARTNDAAARPSQQLDIDSGPLVAARR